MKGHTQYRREGWTNAEKLRAIRLRKEGHTVNQIAEELGRSTSAIRNFLQRNGFCKSNTNSRLEIDEFDFLWMG
jgi:transposase-like protein